jgi:ribosomal protein S18 acetylase RimI-like enzyme
MTVNMKCTDLYTCTTADMHRAAVSCADGFQDDPMWEAVLGDEPKEKLVPCMEIALRHCRKYGTVYGSDDSLAGILAIGPGRYADMTMWRMLLAGSFPVLSQLGSTLGRKMGRVFDPLMKDQKMHMKGRDYIYIYLLSVKKELQGKGIGGTLLRSCIEESRKHRLPLYLETETQQNVAMYEHFGFTVVKKTALPLVHHPMWEMVREVE